MRTRVAPGSSWEVRLSWGRRQLAAAVLGERRRRLSIGNSPHDEWDSGHASRVVLERQSDGDLLVTFTAGVEGTVSLNGDSPTPLAQLVSRGVVVERGNDWGLTLKEPDAAALKLGPLLLSARRARARIRRLSIDVRAMVGIVVALVAIGLTIATSLFGPKEGPKLRWLKPAPTRPDLPPAKR